MTRPEDQSGRSRDSLNEQFLSLIADSGDPPGSQVTPPVAGEPQTDEDNMAESLFLSRVSHTDL